MAFNSNQFNINSNTNIPGALTLALNPNVLDAKISSTQTGTVQNSDGVVIENVQGKLSVTRASAATDNIFGFVTAEIRENEYSANDVVKVAIRDSGMVMTASEAINPGQSLQFNPADRKVAPHSGSNTVIGIALSKASQDGDLLNVLLDTPGISRPVAFTDLTDTPSSIVANNFVKGNATGDAIEFSAS